MRLIFLALPMLLAACGPNPATSWAGKAIQPPVTSRATLSRVVMHVQWGAQAVRANCLPDQDACTHMPKLLDDGEWHAYLFAVEPADFNDLNATEVLGHECWHGFGARHKES